MSSGPRNVAAGFGELAAWVNDPTPRIGWGLSFFDGPTGGGIALGESCMVMSYSSVGKTMIGLNLLYNNPTVPALFMSLEMGWRQVVSRLAAMEHGTSTKEMEAQMRAGGFNPYAQKVMDRFPFLVCDDTPAISIKDAKNSVRKATELNGGHRPKIIVWDFMELIGGSGLLNKSEAVDKSAQKLRDFHREVDAAGIILHQVGKGSNTGGHEPLALDDGKYGGHHPMDYVVGAYAPRLERGLDRGEFERVRPELWLQLLKNRNGGAEPVGVRYHQDPISMRISLWEQQAYSFAGYQQPFGGVA